MLITAEDDEEEGDAVMTSQDATPAPREAPLGGEVRTDGNGVLLSVSCRVVL